MSALPQKATTRQGSISPNAFDRTSAGRARAQLGEALPAIQGDRVQVQQVILNLMINAAEAMSEMSEGSGLGMGLSICRSIIEAHHGRLWASAKHSRGAVFQFTLRHTHNDRKKDR
jgi:C4-dicarboxylate-specific signal transduction histidine kinase